MPTSKAKRSKSSRSKDKKEARSLINEDSLTSEDFFQKSPLKTSLKIKELNWTQKQKDFSRAALSDDTNIMFVKGPAGTSKSLLSVYCGIKLLNKKSVSDIMYLRSAVESSESRLGFLPGSAEEKLSFYNLPFLDKLEELVTNCSVEKLEKEGRISMFPVNFARGMSWNGKFIILDEAQNSSRKEIVTVLTRLGVGSKCFILGDPMQTDLKGNDAAFERMFDLFSDDQSKSAGISTFEFTEEDIMRSELVKFLVTKLKEF
jgi:phosphate starvation-inducible PhoH-like protein|tara:strand:- start:257 stop:1036 length:780 start_codon:yes stop_codon:yes gene_type:complete